MASEQPVIAMLLTIRAPLDNDTIIWGTAMFRGRVANVNNVNVNINIKASQVDFDYADGLIDSNDVRTALAESPGWPVLLRVRHGRATFTIKIPKRLRAKR